MGKFVRIPDKLKGHLDEFSDLFTKPSLASFSQLMSAIAVCDKQKNVYNLYNTMALEDKKNRSSYNWFFNNAKWDEDEIADRKAEMLFKAVGLKKGDQILFIVDDTYEEKKGNATEGVGKFYDHSKGYIWGNRFITSVIQCKGIFIPHKAKMYIKEEDAEEFKNGYEIAFDEMIEPLKVPNGVEVMVVFDSWWFSVEFINKCLGRGYHVTGQLKSDKKIYVSSSIGVSKYAKQFESKDYRRIELKIRGKKKKYWIVNRLVEIDGIGKVKLVISKKSFEDEPKYYFSTNIALEGEEILEIYENRWNIETAHRETNQKLGFKDYQMRSKKAIERFIQMVFSMWTIILIIDLEDGFEGCDRVRISEKIEGIKTSCLIDLFKYVLDLFNIPYPEKKMVNKLRELGYKT
jgi:hypothetical protein